MYQVSIESSGRPVTTRADAAAAAASVLGQPVDVEPIAAADGLWLAELPDEIADQLTADGMLRLARGGAVVSAETP